MIKNDLENALSGKLDVSKARAKKIIDTFFSEVKHGLKNEGRVELRGFGIFLVKNKKTGIARNPRTNEVVQIKSGKTVKFRSGKKLNF